MRAEAAAARVLLAGGVLGVALMVIGLVASAVHQHAGLDRYVPRRALESSQAGRAADTIVSVSQIARGLRQRPVDPIAVSALGIVTLFVTPGVAVVAAGIAFVRDGDRYFVAVSAAIVVALALSFWLGGV